MREDLEASRRAEFDGPEPPAEELDWKPVLAYLDAWGAIESDPGSWVPMQQIEPGVYNAAYGVWAEKLSEFVQNLYDQGVVASFDWPSWNKQHGRRLYEDPDALAQATLEDCRRLLATHVRADRFVEGHLLAEVRSGHIGNILSRVTEVLPRRSV